MKNTKSGFTLIELLVVITIIAVLALVGLVLYSKTQAKARNARRMSDLDAIAKALEVNKTATGYVILNANQFGSGAIPWSDPQGIWYCANSTASTQPADPSLIDISATSCGISYGQVGIGNPPLGTLWKICTKLEDEGAGAKVFCKVNLQ